MHPLTGFTLPVLPQHPFFDRHDSSACSRRLTETQLGRAKAVTSAENGGKGFRFVLTDADLLVRCLGQTQGRWRTTADGREPCNFQLGPWQPEQGCCILTDMRGRLKIPLGPIKIQREACIVRPQPSNLFLSAQGRWRRWAKLRQVYFGAGDEKQTAAAGRWG